MASIALMSAIHSLDTRTFMAAFTRLELRSVLFTLAIICFVLVLAYLTNPSETSFRTFLTEQAFRHHLSSLDEADAEDAQDELEAATSAAVSPHLTEMLTKRGLSGSFSKHRSLPSYASPPFAFANRASVSLRTPKHMFRSFGIFSVAAVVPASTFASLAARSRRIGNAQQSQTQHQRQDTDEDGIHERPGVATSLLWESWFVGAFGMWFWAVNLDGLWRESGFGRRDEADGTVTGVLEVKALDRSDSLTRSSFTSSDNALTNGTKRPAPKLRSRERLTSQNGTALGRRSQTPPPLPKSASLPLHSKRSSTQSSAVSDKPSHNGHAHNIGGAYQSAKSQQPQQTLLISPSLSGHLHHSSSSTDTQEGRLIASISLPTHTTASISTGASASPSRSPSTLFASSPVVADIFRQITASQTALNELRTQLSDFHALASSSRPGLDDELEKQRERKRSDDTARQELKAQLKALEDQKRSAEAARREADKRFKQVRSESDAVDARTKRYEKEMREFVLQMEAQESKIVASGIETGALVEELGGILQSRRAEIREAEEDVAQLALRTRDMEEKIGEEEKRLERAMENAKQRKRASASRRSPTYMDPASNTLSFGDLQPPVHILTRRIDIDATVSPGNSSVLVSSPLTAVPMEPSLSTATTKPTPFVPPPLQTAPSSAAINIGRKLNFDDAGSQYATRDTAHTFAPFESELGSPGLLSPTGERLLPSSLYESLGMGNNDSNSPVSPVSPMIGSGMNMDVSRSFQSDDDLVLDRNWMNQRQLTGSHTMPVSPAESTTEVNKYDAELGYNGNGGGRERMNSLGSRGSLNSSSPMGSNESASFNMFSNIGFPLSQTQSHDSAQQATRKTGWFSHHSCKDGHEKKASSDKKGLNPDAKEFSLSKEKQTSFSAFLHRSRERNGHAASNSGSDSRTSSTPSSASISTPDSSTPSMYNDSASPISPTISRPFPFMSTNSVLGPPPTTATVATTHGSAPSSSQPLSHSHFGGFGFGLGASSWFGGSRAFEPTPLEREQFSLALGSKGNSSFDRLDHFPSSSSVSPAAASASPAVAPAAARAWDVKRRLGFGLNGHGHGPGSRNGHALNGTASTATTAFSPFDDEDPLPSIPFSASSH